MKLFRWRFFRSDCDDVKHVRIPRTLEGNVFEVVALFMLIGLWALAVWMYHHAPETIPTHFDAAGHPNNYGSRLVLIYIAIGGTLVTLFVFGCAYYPSATVNMPIRLDTMHKRLMGARMVRILGLLISLLPAVIILKICYPQASLINWVFFGFIALIGVVVLIFRFVISRIGKKDSN